MNKKHKTPSVRCEDCMFYDYDEEYDEYCCNMSLDEDELVRMSYSKHNTCPYFRFYDEYKSVQKQN